MQAKCKLHASRLPHLKLLVEYSRLQRIEASPHARGRTFPSHIARFQKQSGRTEVADVADESVELGERRGGNRQVSRLWRRLPLGSLRCQDLPRLCCVFSTMRGPEVSLHLQAQQSVPHLDP